VFILQEMLFVGVHELALILLDLGLHHRLTNFLFFKHCLVVLDLLLRKSSMLFILRVICHLTTLDIFGGIFSFNHLLISLIKKSTEFFFLLGDLKVSLTFSCFLVLLSYFKLILCRLHMSIEFRCLNFSRAEFAFNTFQLLAFVFFHFNDFWL